MRRDQLDFREQFRATAELYRQRSRMVLFTLLPLGLGAGLLIFLGGTGSSRSPHPPYVPLPFNVGYLLGLFGAAVVGSLVAGKVWIPTLDCPNCRVNMDTTRDLAYCPQCGEDRVERRTFLGPICRACDKNLTRGRNGRNYKVRFCPGCGAHVDDVGV